MVGLYENRQAVGGATDPQLHSNRTVIHFKREYLVQLYYTRGRRPVDPSDVRVSDTNAVGVPKGKPVPAAQGAKTSTCIHWPLTVDR